MTSMQFALVIILFIHLSSCTSHNLTDILKCKLSHLGLDFTGNIDRTESGVRCQSWNASNPIHVIDKSITDSMFPDGSMQKARNNCRNPNRNPNGPWCYSTDFDLIDDVCDVPLCRFVDCRLTGPGIEYGGTHNRSVSGKICLKWDKNRKVNGLYQEKYSKRRFPDETRGRARNYCRNPNGDIGGPWCYVRKTTEGNDIEKQYCDIPFCDEENCVTFTRSSDLYTQYTELNGTFTNFTFGMKLWDSDTHLNASARLLLSLFAAPLTSSEISEMHTGLEIYISNKHCALTIGGKDAIDYEPSVGILKSSGFSYFSLVWGAGFIALHVKDTISPIFLSEYKSKTGLFGVHRDQFFFYSIQGTNILWSMSFCDEIDVCDVHSTTSNHFERFWPLRKTNTASYDLKFYVRAFHSAIVLFQISPTENLPSIQLILSRPDNTTRVLLYNYETSSVTELATVTILHLLDYWVWNEFTVTLFGDTMQIYWQRDIESQLIAEVNHDLVAAMRWFSPGSDDSLVQWTFFCSPSEHSTPPPAWPPDCVLNKDEVGYVGSQQVTSAGHPCLPWAYQKQLTKQIVNKDAITYWNNCRDPFGDGNGTFCQVVLGGVERKFVLEKCNIRRCKSMECRIAGTGNDYIGTLNITRSNRTCQRWTATVPHQVSNAYINNSLYPDENIKDANNYCRDPSRNIAGPWCYTTDEQVPMDTCNVRDCAKPEECIIMTKGNGQGRRIYILPQWKETGIDGGLHFALKEWNPDLLDGIVFEFEPEHGAGYLQLVIGADQNERVILRYGSSRRDLKLLKEKSLPHLIPAGRWAAFRLQIRRGEISLSHEGSSVVLFEWKHTDITKAFEPRFFTYMSIANHIIGVYFRCSDCHTEITNTSVFTRIMPISLWNPTENVTNNNLTFYLRGTGIALVPLMFLPSQTNYYAVTIGDFGNMVFFVENTKTRAITLKSVNLTDPPLQADRWSRYMFLYNEHMMQIFKDDVSILVYESKVPMFFYWFSIGAQKGWVTWIANCAPPDIDGPPLDGGWSVWSSWHCTVSCGGGEGHRTRTCTNPRPNIRGKLCDGPSVSTGRCNEFKCGDINPQTLNKIRDRLKNERHSFVVDEGDTIVLQNDVEIWKQIKNESPKAELKWTLNGMYLSSKRTGILVKQAMYRHSAIYGMPYYIHNPHVYC